MLIMQKKVGEGSNQLTVTSGLYAQWDATDISTFEKTGAVIDRWNVTSQSSSSMYMENQGVGSGGIESNINGVPSVTTTQQLDFVDTSGTSHTAASVFLVTNQTSAAGSYPLFFGGGADVTGQYFGIEQHNGASGSVGDNGLDIYYGFANDRRLSLVDIAKYDILHRYSIILPGNQNAVTMYDKGIGASATSTGSTTALNARLGPITYQGATQNGRLFSGQNVGELLVYNRAVTNQERLDIETYLTTKWGS